MDRKPEFDGYQEISSQLLLLIDKVHCLTNESWNYQQTTLYFDGYLHGLQYALAVVQRTIEEEDAHGNP